MSLLQDLENRSKGQCELCTSTTDVQAFLIAPRTEEIAENQVALCSICYSEQDNESLNDQHFRCLNDSMWSEHTPVKVLSFRLLDRLKSKDWAQNLLDMIYLEEQEREWAEWKPAQEIIHLDCNGQRLEAGDSVTLIKDLHVKGSSLKAKQGTHVRRIRLDHENPNHIEGKVEGQNIVILTQYVKKSK
ncbi:MAG: PhnA domain-containing protein [Flavobacteriales bacterium]